MLRGLMALQAIFRGPRTRVGVYAGKQHSSTHWGCSSDLHTKLRACTCWAFTWRSVLLPWLSYHRCCRQGHRVVHALSSRQHSSLCCGNTVRLYVGCICPYTGAVDRVTPNIKTGRADYFGQPVNRAARLMSAAHGGQIVCDQALLQEVRTLSSSARTDKIDH